MKLCRYDDDRLGVVRGELIHDVTQAQTQIRAAAPYAMKGDAVIAALPAWRARLEEMAVLQAAMRADSRDARALYYLGNLLYDRRRHADAIRLWKIAPRAAIPVAMPT